MAINNVGAVSDALKYINGMDINKESESIAEDLKASVFSPLNLVFGGMEVGSGIKHATGEKKIFDAAKSLKNLSTQDATLKGAIDFFENKAEAAAAEKAAKTAAAAGKKGIFSTIKSGIKSFASKIPGSKAVGGFFGKIGKTGFGKVLKGTGAAGMLIFDGIIGLATEVVPAFEQGGAKSGFKQLGKTAVKTAASAAGWAGGSVAGKFVGSLVGSIFGPAGTVVGGAIGGFIGSIAGSALCSGVAKKLTGKSEVEIAEEKQFDEQAVQIANDPVSMQELNQMVQAQVQTEIVNGAVDEDTEKMAACINSGALQTASTVNSGVNQTGVYEQSFNGAVSPTAAGQTNTFAYDTQSAQNTAQASTVPVNNFNDINYLASEAAKGNTEIYKISDDKLNSVFNKSAQTTNPVQTSTEFDTLDPAETESIFNTNGQEKINYFS